MSEAPGPDSSPDAVFSGRFPLHRACRDGDVRAVEALLPAASLEEDSRYGWSALHWAAHYGQLECVVRLVQAGCEVNTVTSRFNQTPTHTAAFGGHPHCVVWLTQAGADVNSQDFVGETPIHKAARSGSLECIQVLLLADAKPHLRNASGQTAADLAHAHGFLDCFSLISKTNQQQLGGLGGNGAPNGDGAPCGEGLLGRKRLLAAAVDAGLMKKARGADDGGEELESMNAESSQDLVSDAVLAGSPESLSPPSPPAGKQAASAPAQRSSADMCGSLHLSGSPSSCVSHRPAWWGQMGADCRDFLRYGHYHGFGDTAEELSDGSCPDAGGGGGIHLYQDS
ncbi:ankyrin repeat domain-containing protein 10-like [Anoplopoma fimbria]|uniref:ankyrin repeat domain-containing protein 10-like n=1 Tax=Anoplopoma fimbria TaxID=229290 RepID=UPI0023ED84CA|nr:ankyrin repeat domain-containing protein 10-like [Anoplopoma fimbria]